MNKKSLSIIIPVYNGEKYIGKMLDSILSVDAKDIEVIVVNDGSTDKTENICSKYKNIQLYTIKNHGVSYARNYAIKKASGKYLMFVDCDDALKDNWYEAVSKYFDKDYDVVYFSHDLNQEYDKKNIIYNILDMSSPCIAATFSKLFNKKMIDKNDISFPANVINGEDMIFNVNCLNHALKFTVDNNSFYLYRIYLGSSTKRFDSKVFETSFLFLDELKKEFINTDYINDDEKNDIILFFESRTITFISNRLAYIKPYKDAKKLFATFNQEKYREIIQNELKNKHITKIKKLAVFLCKYKLYFFVYTLYRARIIINKYFRKNERFIEI